MLQKHGKDVDLVVYGFIDAQLGRNVSPLASTLSPYASYVPFLRKNKTSGFSISDEYLYDNIRHSSSYYQNNAAWWNLIAHFNTGVSVLLDRMRSFQAARARSEDSNHKKLDAAAWVLRKMEQFTAESGANLLVANVGVARSDEEFKLLSRMSWQDHVHFVNASTEIDQPIEDLVIPRDGHPNALANQIIADRLADYIKITNLLHAPATLATDEQSK